jgi:hypothetical protein
MEVGISVEIASLPELDGDEGNDGYGNSWAASIRSSEVDSKLSVP